MKQKLLLIMFGGIFQTTFATNATDYFRSIQSGNWNSIATWQSSGDSAVWNTATLVPDSNAKSITISSGATVALTPATTASYVYVANGAVLTHPSSSTFDITKLFSVFGTYVLNGTQPTFHNGATADIIGVVRVDGNTGGQSDNFAFSMSVFFETGSIFQWNISTIFQTSSIVYFPNASSNITPIFKVTRHVGAIGSTTTTTFNGKFVCDSSIIFQRSGTKVFRDGFGGVGTITHSQNCGTFSITGTNAVIDGSVTLSIINDTLGFVDMSIAANSSTTVFGNASVIVGTSGSGAQLQIDGTLVQNSSSAVDLSHGSLIVHGAISGSGSLKAKSNATDISVGGSATDAGMIRFVPEFDTVRNFTMNRFGGQIDLASDMAVASTLTLTKGIVTTGDYLLTHDNRSSYIPPTNYSDAYICTCRSDGSSSSLLYPYDGAKGFRETNVVQNADAWFSVSSDLVSPNRAYIKNTDSLVDTYTVFLAKGDVGNTPLPNINRIWYVKNTSITPKATMRLYFTKRDWTQWPTEDEIIPGFNYGDIHLVQKDYVQRFQDNSTDSDVKDFISTSYGSEIYGQYSVGVSSDSVGNRFGITSFSRFAVVNAAGVLLPVKLISFTITEIRSSVVLDWKITDPQMISHFVVEKSSDGVRFEPIESVVADSRSSYQYEDMYPYSGDSYYRLRIVDKNSKEFLSKNMFLHYKKYTSRIFPNPATYSIFISDIDADHMPILIYDMAGRKIIEKYANSSFESLDISRLASGVYFCKVGSDMPIKIIKR